MCPPPLPRALSVAEKLPPGRVQNPPDRALPVGEKLPPRRDLLATSSEPARRVARRLYFFQLVFPRWILIELR